MVLGELRFDPRSDAALALAYQGGAQATGDVLVRRHGPLVTKIVHSFCRRWHRWNIDEEGLRQEGFIIFLRLVHAYDAADGELTTYVRSVLPGNLMEVLGAHSTLQRKRGTLRRHAEMLRDGEALPAWALHPVSIDAAPEDGGAPIADFPSSDPGPADLVEAREEEQVVREAFHGLDPRSSAILRRRYLVDEPETQEEVGASFGVSGSAIGYAERAALETLRRRCAR